VSAFLVISVFLFCAVWLIAVCSVWLQQLFIVGFVVELVVIYFYVEVYVGLGSRGVIQVGRLAGVSFEVCADCFLVEIDEVRCRKYC